MAAYYVGLDVHSRDRVFVIQDEAGTILARGMVPTTPEGFARMRDKHHVPPGTRVALETGTSAFYVARLLAALHLEPVVVDAHEVRRKASRPSQKSDRRDALEICDGVRRDYYRAVVHIPSPAISMLRTTLSRRRHFIRIQTAEVNAAKRLLRGVGWPGGTRMTLRSATSWDRLVAALVTAPDLQPHVRGHYAVWQQAGAQVRATDHFLGELARDRRPEVRRLEAVPGVGPIVALTAIAVFAGARRFASAKHAASYAGLVPSTYQSGACDRHGHITKRGSAELRAMLCEAAHQARRPSHPLNPYFLKLCARRGYKAAIVAVAHRLCRLLYALLRDGSKFQPTRLGVEAGPFTQTVTRQYRLTPKPAGRLFTA
jgi:transposase